MCEQSLYCEINQEVNRRVSVILDTRRRRSYLISVLHIYFIEAAVRYLIFYGAL